MSPLRLTVADVPAGRFEASSETDADGRQAVTVGFWTKGQGNQVFRLGLSDARKLAADLVALVDAAEGKP